MRGCTLDGWGVYERGGTSAPMCASMAKALAGHSITFRSCATPGTHGASQAFPARTHRTTSAARRGCGARTSTIRTAGTCCPCHAATARPSLAVCGTGPRRGSMRSTSITSCRCSPMPQRAGRSMRDARTGGRGRKAADGASTGAGHGENLLGADGGGGSYVSKRGTGMCPLSTVRRGAEEQGVFEEYRQVLGWSVRRRTMNTTILWSARWEAQ